MDVKQRKWNGVGWQLSIGPKANAVPDKFLKITFTCEIARKSSEYFQLEHISAVSLTHVFQLKRRIIHINLFQRGKQKHHHKAMNEQA